MTIAQISDIHISLENEKPYGTDVRSRFLCLLSGIAASGPDLLVLTGDLAFRRGMYSIYRWIKKQLDSLDIPYFVLGGNHDDRFVLRAVFGRCFTGAFAVVEEGSFRLIFLGRGKDRFSLTEKRHLKREGGIDRLKILFMHYPPFPAGVPYMDRKYPFRDGEFLRVVLEEGRGEWLICCGHYHRACDSSFYKCRQLVSPSPFFTMDDTAEGFKRLDEPPAWRLLRIGKEIETELLYEDFSEISDLE